MTTITLENKYGKYSISVNIENMNIFEMEEELFKPLLGAMGYHHNAIAKLFGGEND